MRRDLEDNKRRTTEIMSENNDIRRERDVIKLEKNELLI